MNHRNALGKTLRILTAPPVLAVILAGFLRCFRSELFAENGQLWLLILMLAILPASAYPLQRIIPKLQNGGRNAQRRLAFITTLVGYLGAFLLGRLLHAPSELQMLYDTYVFSVCLLTLFNKGFHLKASGHACGTMGALIFSVVLISPVFILPGILIVIGMAWSSLSTGSHTVRELILGAVTSLASYSIVWFFYR